MTNPGTLLVKIAENLPHMETDQKSLTEWVGRQIKDQDIASVVEGHNLAIKLQRAFEENILKSMVG